MACQHVALPGLQRGLHGRHLPFENPVPRPNHLNEGHQATKLNVLSLPDALLIGEVKNKQQIPKVLIVLCFKGVRGYFN